MKRPLLLYVIAALICFGLSGFAGYKALTPSESAPPPIMKFAADRTEHDFGDVRQQETLETTFRFTNTLAQPVEITSVMKGCGCTEAVVSPETILAGGEAELRIRWEIGTRRGKVSEHVTLIYSVAGKSDGMIAVSVRANVLPEFECTPDAITFDPIREGEVRVACRPTQEPEARLVKATTDHAQVRAAVEPDGATVVLRFTPDPGLPAGDKPVHVYLATSSKREPTIRLPIRFRK